VFYICSKIDGEFVWLKQEVQGADIPMSIIRSKNRQNIKEGFKLPVLTASVQVQTTVQIPVTSSITTVKLQRTLSTPKSQIAGQSRVSNTTPLKRRISPRTLAKASNPTPPKRRKVGDSRMSWSWTRQFPRSETDENASTLSIYRF
jgi:hypothetical protein